MAHVASTRALLTDAFGRIADQVTGLTSGLDPSLAAYSPGPDANPVTWLLWHLSRIQDDHVADLAGREQVWTADGWYERSGLPLPPTDTGYGHSPDQVAAVSVPADLIAGYHGAVHAMTTEYVDGLTAGELARVVDETWQPPVTVGVRLVSVLQDTLEHVGQAAYVAGLAKSTMTPTEPRTDA